MCRHCEDGRTTDNQGEIITLTNGEPLWCVECVEGLEMELRRVSRMLCGLAETIAQYDALEQAGGLYAWAQTHRAMTRQSYEKMISWHDQCERKLLRLVGTPSVTVPVPA